VVETYRGHFIVASAARDEVIGKYIPLASITWEAKDGKRGRHLLDDLPQQYTTPEEANLVALTQARIWVDERLKFSD
jgi:hypothetical protein